MQEILTNGKFFVNDDKKTFAEAVLANEGAIVLASTQKEVLDLKTKETSVFDLNGEYVFPCGFEINARIFKRIGEKLKDHSKDYIVEEPEKDENYEKFENYEAYKKEFLNIQNELIKRGITTISEFDANKDTFVFYKKISEEKLLKIDVALYINLANSKSVMDDNCVTYRKYKNHVRLGGYYLKIDGALQELKAWLSKAYSGTKAHFGAGEIVGEQLYFLVKNALDEKKQLVFETNGDKAVEEILNVFDELAEKEKIENFYRPILYGANIIYPKFVKKLKKYDFSLCLNDYDLTTKKTVKKFIGIFRKRWFYNYLMLIKSGIRFVFCKFEYEFNVINFPIKIMIKSEKQLITIKRNKNKFDKYLNLLSDIIYNNPTYLFFDQDTKGTIETQKRVNFFVCDKDIFCCHNNDYKIKMTFLNENRTEY